MGLFDFLIRRPGMEEGLAQWRETPNAVLLDVRTPEEYRSGHVPGARNLPLDRLGELSPTASAGPGAPRPAAG